MTAIVNTEKCSNNGVCVNVCPVEAITIENEKAVIDAEKCIDCGLCVDACPESAITMSE